MLLRYSNKHALNDANHVELIFCYYQTIIPDRRSRTLKSCLFIFFGQRSCLNIPRNRVKRGLPLTGKIKTLTFLHSPHHKLS